MKTAITQMLKINYPIIQAPMAGGPAMPKLVAAVSNAGGLGSLGAGYLKPEQLRLAIHEIKQLTKQPFAVNLFVPEQVAPSGEVEQSIARMSVFLEKYCKELNLESAPLPAFSQGEVDDQFNKQIEMILEEGVSIASFTFGIPPESVRDALKKHHVTVIGTATTVEEAKLVEESGAAAVVAQGSEAGGHRGTFLKDACHSQIGLMALVPQVVDHVAIPVIAAGGIMDGRGLAASLMLGAAAAQMGTVFLPSHESGAHPLYKRKVLAAQEDDTAITYAYSGKAARGIHTTFMKEMDSYSGNIPPYPIQNMLTRDLRQAAAATGYSDYMSLWAGQGLRLAEERSAAQIVDKTMKQASELMGM